MLLDKSQLVKRFPQIRRITPMQIAIIGSGNVGRALASSMTRAGHAVTLSAADETHAREAAAQTGATAASTNQDAISAADVVVLAVPASSLDAIADEIGTALRG